MSSTMSSISMGKSSNDTSTAICYLERLNSTEAVDMIVPFNLHRVMDHIGLDRLTAMLKAESRGEQ